MFTNQIGPFESKISRHYIPMLASIPLVVGTFFYSQLANVKGNGQIPRLSGQHVNYMVKQIEIFKKTEQRPRGVTMKQITHDLSKTDIKAVAE